MEISQEFVAFLDHMNFSYIDFSILSEDVKNYLMKFDLIVLRKCIISKLENKVIVHISVMLLAGGQGGL